MKCPVCQSKVEFLRSLVDGQPIQLCSNAACGWERLPQDAPRPEAEDSQFNKNEALLARLRRSDEAPLQIQIHR